MQCSHFVHILPVGGQDEQSCVCLIVFVLIFAVGVGMHNGEMCAYE